MPHAIMPWAQIAPNYHRNTILLGNGASIAVSPVLDYGSLPVSYTHLTLPTIA